MPALKLLSDTYIPTVKRTTGIMPERSPLIFKPITLQDLPAINRIVGMSDSFTCDYTIGGIFMWINYFEYSYCIYDDTLFISGKSENHLDQRAFSCPIGKLPLPKAIELLKQYCDENNITLRFSAVPADRMTCFTAFNPLCQTEELEDWGDYVYEAESFATLAGKKMAKKRNHVNRFIADNPDYFIEPITAQSATELKKAIDNWHSGSDDGSSTEDEENYQVKQILDNLNSYPFKGIILRTAPGGEIVAFTLAEIIRNMAFVHIEKMNHAVAGAGETVAHLFIKYLKSEYPELKYINREEDCGDPGLRRAKESWQPAMVLKKYNVTL